MAKIPPAVRKYVIDLTERVVATFLASGGAVLIAAGPADLFHASVWEAAASGGVAAVLTLLKGLAARYRGQKSASLAKSV